MKTVDKGIFRHCLQGEYYLPRKFLWWNGTIFYCNFDSVKVGFIVKMDILYTGLDIYGLINLLLFNGIIYTYIHTYIHTYVPLGEQFFGEFS